jgi:hypothetical protein
LLPPIFDKPILQHGVELAGGCLSP